MHNRVSDMKYFSRQRLAGTLMVVLILATIGLSCGCDLGTYGGRVNDAQQQLQTKPYSQ